MCKYGDFEEIIIASQKHKGIPITGAHAHRVNVDRCIAPLVEMLNIYGIQTIACCCGHGKTAHSRIKISAHNLELIPLGEDLTVHLKFPYPGSRMETS